MTVTHGVLIGIYSDSRDDKNEKKKGMTHPK